MSGEQGPFGYTFEARNIRFRINRANLTKCLLMTQSGHPQLLV
jgi:hypothetical protein